MLLLKCCLDFMRVSRVDKFIGGLTIRFSDPLIYLRNLYSLKVEGRNAYILKIQIMCSVLHFHENNLGILVCIELHSRFVKDIEISETSK